MSHAKGIAVVVGAGLIGSAIAGHLAKVGYFVDCVGHDRLELADPASIAKYFECWEQVDLLVNAAGTYGAIGKVGEVAPQAWLRALQVNLLGVYGCVHHALAKMPAGGHIISLMGGGAAAIDHLSGYCAAKQGLARLMQTVAVEYPDIHANSISPGPMMSRMQEPLLALDPEAAGSNHAVIRRIRDTGAGAVPVENTLRVVDHILEACPSGAWFSAREFAASNLMARMAVAA